MEKAKLTTCTCQGRTACSSITTDHNSKGETVLYNSLEKITPPLGAYRIKSA